MVAKQAIEKVKNQLLLRRQELEQDFSKHETFSDNTVQDPGDQAVSSTMESLHNSLQDTKLQEYRRIVKALRMIEDGTYGICVDCSEAILEKRLKSFPNASRCLGCQEAYEDQKD